MRGAFGEEALRETAWAMLFYGCGIPFFCTTKVIVSAFYSRKDMTTPLKISVFCIMVNLVLNLTLMIWLKQGGIALATVIASLLNNFLLLWILKKKFSNYDLKLRSLLPDSVRSVMVSAVLVLPLLYIYPLIMNKLGISWLPNDLLPLALCGSIFCVMYFLITLFSGSAVPKTLLKLFVKE
jgi:putative peptidoglycan lipid II flippase